MTVLPASAGCACVIPGFPAYFGCLPPGYKIYYEPEAQPQQQQEEKADPDAVYPYNKEVKDGETYQVY